MAATVLSHFGSQLAQALNATSDKLFPQSVATVYVPVGYAPTYWESKWLQLFDNSEYPAVTLAFVLFIWHEFVFFGRFFPYFVMDQFPYFKKYKIQDTKENDSAAYWKCVKYVILCQLFLQLPMLMLFHPVATSMGMKFLEVPFPSISTVVLSCIFCLIVEDAYHYWVHRAMHYGALYKYIHKMHHEYSAPFGIAAEYAHPIEVLVLGQGFFLGPAILLAAGVDVHVITMAWWMGLRLFETVDVHCGYDFPWSVHNWMPFWGGSDFHDYHHMAFVSNFSSSFRWWDWMFGTDAKYNAWKARTKAEKAEKAKKLQ
ncbi:C-4 sterol methyl oxidase [Gaertneriomyces sp. JEL0708]|nr:C-4 sterol methyl oxidase [Gaertneriomyces sp. JEL0708]